MEASGRYGEQREAETEEGVKSGLQQQASQIEAARGGGVGMGVR